ncbi:hypothetical protein GCM10010912_16230 [Paenibacillus albidus]|uniref:DUF3231 family protein n=1 Tax=Paenibacillus albidus TaxID=2041023 RepID=A0A917FF30_9BACL|nr:DUF3231 family protein [Paenibacillus albidus]GGF71841.1 hypothetical protein GCM10010912_16230 [Paenibacillus albidus]
MVIPSSNPKDEAMHTGPTFTAWQFAAKAQITLSTLQAFHYHAADQELKHLIDDLMDQTQRGIKDCDKLLRAEGIPPFPPLPDRLSVKPAEIPSGARLSDLEIAAALSGVISMSLAESSQLMNMSIRADLTALFMKIHAALAASGLALLKINKHKGWLPPLPVQIRQPELVHA